MSGMEAGVVLLFGAIGFGGAWHLLGLLSSKRKSEEAFAGEESGAGAAEGAEPRWFEILGVSEASEWAAIKAAYLRQISNYHPDRFAALDHEFGELASSRAKAINEAFETAKRLRGRRQG